MARRKAQDAEQAPQQEKAQDAEQAPQLVRMVRDESYPSPREASVHPDEVQNYASGGWVVQA